MLYTARDLSIRRRTMIRPEAITRLYGRPGQQALQGWWTRSGEHVAELGVRAPRALSLPRHGRLRKVGATSTGK